MAKGLNHERLRIRDLVRQSAQAPKKPLVDRLQDDKLRASLRAAINATKGKSAKDYTFALSLQRQAIKFGNLSPAQKKCLSVLIKRTGAQP